MEIATTLLAALAVLALLIFIITRALKKRERKLEQVRLWNEQPFLRELEARKSYWEKQEKGGN